MPKLIALKQKNFQANEIQREFKKNYLLRSEIIFLNLSVIANGQGGCFKIFERENVYLSMRSKFRTAGFKYENKN